MAGRPGPEIGDDDLESKFAHWAADNRIFIHPSLQFVKSPSGHDVYAIEEIPRESKVLSCPWDRAITAPQSRAAITTAFYESSTSVSDVLDRWSERQVVCVYMILHRIWHETKKSTLPPVFQHKPYLDMLPSSELLQTTMYFTQEELGLLKGSNLYQATMTRHQEWQVEWKACLEGLSAIDEELTLAVTWEHYLAAATHLSSRAFPSTLLSDSPSNTSPDQSHAVLLPGIDSLNHRRATPVSWVSTVSKDPDVETSNGSPTLDGSLDLIIHEPVLAGTECFNNYGPKPNSELILGYGFAIPFNPDDTILLSLAASNTEQTNIVEIGRGAKNAMRLWELVFNKVKEMGEVDMNDSSPWELELEAAEIIVNLTEQRMERLPSVKGNIAGARQSVLDMIEYYLEGQRAILVGLIQWAETKRIEAQGKARAEGIDIVFEDELE